MDFAGETWNWLDAILVVLVLVSVVGAVRNGLTKEVVRLVALLIGVAAGLWWHDSAARLFTPYIENPQAAAFAGFLSILLASLVLGGIVAWFLARLWGLVGLRWFDRLLGAAFGLARGVVVSTALVLGLLTFSPLEGTSEVIAQSRLAPLVLHSAQATVTVAPRRLRESFQGGFEQVRQIWLGPAAESPPAP